MTEDIQNDPIYIKLIKYMAEEFDWCVSDDFTPIKDSMPSTRFREDFGFDDLDMVELIMGVEEEFSITIEPEVDEKIETVSDLFEEIKKRISK